MNEPCLVFGTALRQSVVESEMKATVFLRRVHSYRALHHRRPGRFSRRLDRLAASAQAVLAVERQAKSLQL